MYFYIIIIIIIIIITYRLPVNQRRGYKNVFDAMFRIVREEGIMTLWRVSTSRSVSILIVFIINRVVPLL